MKKGFLLFLGLLSATQGFSKMPHITSNVYVQGYLGATASLSYGDYVKYHKSFIEVADPDAEISGGIKPIYFFTVGVQGLWKPFSDTGSILSNLGIITGFGYSKQGFTSKYVSEYDNPTRDINTTIRYQERYSMNILSIPVMVRWGNKFFGEIGVSHNRILSGHRTQTLKQKSDGSDAYQGGYDISETERAKLNKGLLNTSSTGFVIGGGVNMNRMSVRLDVYLYRKLLSSASSFNSLSPQLQLVFPIMDIVSKKSQTAE